jgi:hypothetical protein
MSDTLISSVKEILTYIHDVYDANEEIQGSLEYVVLKNNTVDALLPSAEQLERFPEQKRTVENLLQILQNVRKDIDYIKSSSVPRQDSQTTLQKGDGFRTVSRKVLQKTRNNFNRLLQVLKANKKCETLEDSVQKLEGNTVILKPVNEV